MASEWITYVKQYAKKHNITYKQALKEASPSYRALAANGKLQSGDGVVDFITGVATHGFKELEKAIKKPAKQRPFLDVIQEAPMPFVDAASQAITNQVWMDLIPGLKGGAKSRVRSAITKKTRR
jgi:hypothetical protein